MILNSIGMMTLSKLPLLICLGTSMIFFLIEQWMKEPRGPKYPWLQDVKYWKGTKTKKRMKYLYPQTMLNSGKLYQREWCPRFGRLVKIHQVECYKSPYNFTTRTLTKSCQENLARMITCCNKKWLTSTSDLRLYGSRRLQKLSTASRICKYLYLKKALLMYMGWNPKKSSSKQLSYSEKRLESHQHLLSTILELKQRM